MKHRFPVTAAIVLAGVAVAATSDAPTRAAPTAGPSTVIVQNAPTQPVPTAAQGTTTVAGTVSLAAGAQVALAGDVRIATSPGDPLVVHEATPSITTSMQVRIVANTTGTPVLIPRPACADGASFLVTDLAASPDLFLSGTFTKDWGAYVIMWQRTSSGDDEVPLTVWGHGLDQASLSIAGGQVARIAAQNPETTPVINAGVYLESADTRDRIFDLHITGHCGQPFVAEAHARVLQ